MQQVTRQYNDVLSWADIYAESPMDVKKMIVAQLISAVRVSKDYVIEIDFRISERELGLEQEQEIEIKPKAKKRKSEPELWRWRRLFGDVAHPEELFLWRMLSSPKSVFKKDKKP